MHLVMDKKSKEILHVNPAPPSQGLTPKEVYYLFDSKTMEIGRSEGPPPEHFRISRGEIVELSPREKVKAGIITLEPGQELVGDAIVEKVPEEKAEPEPVEPPPPPEEIVGPGAVDAVELAIKAKTLKTAAQCREAIERLNADTEREIFRRFSPGRELSLIKAYMEWQTEGKPLRDPREREYLAMQKTIEGIKAEQGELKKKIRAILAKLGKKK